MERSFLRESLGERNSLGKQLFKQDSVMLTVRKVFKQSCKRVPVNRLDDVGTITFSLARGDISNGLA